METECLPDNAAETQKLDQALVYGNIRRQIAKWQQSQNNIELKKIKRARTICSRRYC